MAVCLVLHQYQVLRVSQCNYNLNMSDYLYCKYNVIFFHLQNTAFYFFVYLCECNLVKTSQQTIHKLPQIHNY